MKPIRKPWSRRRGRRKAAIGVKQPHWASLGREIFADFAEQQPYGIGWWAPGPGTSRRILIADQLSCCLASVAGNMTEASLHWLEYLDASDRDSAPSRRCREDASRRPVHRPAAPAMPFRTARPRFCPNASGRFDPRGSHPLSTVSPASSSASPPCRKVFSRRISSKPAQCWLTSTARPVPGAKAQADFAARLEAAIAAAGPHGWLDWTLDLRNMLVHRGRRIELGQYLPITPVLLGPDGKPAPRARRVSHLPRDPGRSDIEVFVDTPWNMVLHEEETRTLRGLMNSTSLLLEAGARHLLDLWRWRRAHPGDLRQPADQWKNGPSKQSTGFNGYAPGSLPLEPSMGMMHPATARRFHAAALDDASRPQWATFD